MLSECSNEDIFHITSVSKIDRLKVSSPVDVKSYFITFYVKFYRQTLDKSLDLELTLFYPCHKKKNNNNNNNNNKNNPHQNLSEGGILEG